MTWGAGRVQGVCGTCAGWGSCRSTKAKASSETWCKRWIIGTLGMPTHWHVVKRKHGFSSPVKHALAPCPLPLEVLPTTFRTPIDTVGPERRPADTRTISDIPPAAREKESLLLPVLTGPAHPFSLPICALPESHSLPSQSHASPSCGRTPRTASLHRDHPVYRAVLPPRGPALAATLWR